MCLALYIATDQALPLVPWDAERPALHLQEAVFHPRNPLTDFLSKPLIYSVGSHQGCGCGFADDALEGDQARQALVDHLAAALRENAEVEVYVCWSGEEGQPPKLRRHARPDDFATYHRTLLRCGTSTVVTLHAPAPTDPPTAGLRLQTDPPGATVKLDGQPRGVTPFADDTLAPGRHSLTVELPGYAPRTWQLELAPDRTLDWDTIPLARPGSLVTIWRIGCPHQGDTPSSDIPDELARLIQSLGFRSTVQALPARSLVEQFTQAWERDGGAGLPDIVVGNNYLPFRDLEASRNCAAPLVRSTGVLRMLGAFAHLVPQSPGHAAARQIATVNQGMTADSFNWSLDESWLADLPAASPPEPDRALLDRQNRQTVTAYHAGDLHRIAHLLHPDMLGRQGTTEANDVADLRTFYILGNARLALILAAATFENGKELGCAATFSVWVKSRDRWQLLAITDDPVTNHSIYDAFPQLAASLHEQLDAPPEPARLLPPTDDMPSPTTDGDYGEFCWTQSPGVSSVAATSAVSASALNAPPAVVVAEIAEFHYGDADRLFFNPGGRVSAGALWTTGTRWAWRVWTVGADGQIALSDIGRFAH